MKDAQVAFDSVRVRIVALYATWASFMANVGTRS